MSKAEQAAYEQAVDHGWSSSRHLWALAWAAALASVDDAKGKPCPSCGVPLASMSTVNGGERHCVGCGSVWNWPLDPGQQSLLGNNRQTKKSRP